jgi:hypothetical protein
MKRFAIVFLCLVSLIGALVAVPYLVAQRERARLEKTIEGSLSPGMTRAEVESICEKLGWAINYAGIGSEMDRTRGFSYSENEHVVFLPFAGQFRVRLQVAFEGETLTRVWVETYHEAL